LRPRFHAAPSPHPSHFRGDRPSFARRDFGDLFDFSHEPLPYIPIGLQPRIDFLQRVMTDGNR